MESIANWLWQGSALAIVATVVLHSSKRISATTRYRLWWVTLSLVLLLPAAPAITFSTGSAFVQRQVTAVGSAAVSTTGDRVASLSLPVAIPAVPRGWIVLGCIVWGLWLLASCVRVAMAVGSLRRAKSEALEFPRDRESRLLTWNSVRHDGRGCSLALSDRVDSAAVLGLSSPLIAISPRLLAELSADELDRIVVHEWAHVQRKDDLGRFAQVAVRAFAGLHPAVWWIDRQLHIEREAACDDWAVNLTGSARGYAACLTKLAAIRLRTIEPMLVPAALSSSDLARRVVRLLDARRSRSTRGRAIASVLIAAPLVATAMAVTTVELAVMSQPLSSRWSLDATGATGSNGTPPLVQDNQVESPARIAPVTARDDERPRATARPERSQPSPQSPTSATTSKRAGGATPESSTPQVLTADLPVTQEALLPGTETPVSVIGGAPGVNAPDRNGSTLREPTIPGTPWGVAADAGAGVGRGSQKAAVATAGFFSKLGKSIARAF